MKVVRFACFVNND